jgi:GNAT superfamily N-acetyltransferase
MFPRASADFLCSIRPGQQDDWRALRLLLPEAVHFGSNVTTLIAADPSNGLMVGAVAIAGQFRSEPQPGLRVAVQVIPPFQNRGVEEQLLLAAEQIVRSRGGKAIYTWGAIEVNSEVSRFWERMGFDHAEHVQEGRTDIATGLACIEPFWQELIRRGKVPQDINALPFDQADPAALARLYVAHIGGDYDTIYQRLTGALPPSFDPAASTVIKLGTDIVGLSLGRPMTREVLLVEAVIVDPSFRGRWANLFLKRESWRRCALAGIRTVIYYTHDRHQDTRRFGDKTGTTIRDFLEPYRTLNPV